MRLLARPILRTTPSTPYPLRCVNAANLASACLIAATAAAVWLLVAGGRLGQAVALVGILGLCGVCVCWLFALRPASVLIFGWILFVAQQPLVGYVGAKSAHGATLVGRLDDALLLLLAGMTLLRRLVGAAPPRRPTVWFVVLFVILAGIGLASGLLRDDVGPWSFIGMWLSLKVLIVIATACELPWKAADYDQITRIALIAGAVVGGFAVIDYVSPSTLHTILHTKFVANSPNQPARAHYVQSVFQSPSRYSNFMTVLFAIAVGRYAVERRPLFLAAAIVFGGAGLASLRLRGLLAAVAVVCVLVIVIREGRFARSLQLGAAILACVAILGPAAFSGQVDRFSSQGDNTARGHLYSDAFRLAEDRFPVGVGFGRYGSYASSLYYSPLYDQLGLSYDFGFSRANPDFITDAGLAGYIAELGAPATLLFLSGLVVLGFRLAGLARRPGAGRGPATVALAILVATVTMSVASASLLDSAIVTPLAVFVGLAFATPETAPQ
jgi:hypothetical protein